MPYYLFDDPEDDEVISPCPKCDSDNVSFDWSGDYVDVRRGLVRFTWYVCDDCGRKFVEEVY